MGRYNRYNSPLSGSCAWNHNKEIAKSRNSIDLNYLDVAEDLLEQSNLQRDKKIGLISIVWMQQRIFWNSKIYKEICKWITKSRNRVDLNRLDRLDVIGDHQWKENSTIASNRESPRTGLDPLLSSCVNLQILDIKFYPECLIWNKDTNTKIMLPGMRTKEGAYLNL